MLDREAWRHDAGALGADNRGRGRLPEDPPVGPLPLTASGVAHIGGLAGVASGAMRLFTAALLARRRPKRRRP